MSRLKPTIKEILLTDPSARDAAAQEDYERRFYTRLRLANDIYKTTHGRRFEDVNPFVNELLPTDRTVQLLDVGISSGISTMEWLESIQSRGTDAQIVAGDLDITGYLISAGSWLDMLIDRRGCLLQIDLCSRSITHHYRFPLWRRLLLAVPVWCLNAAYKIFWLLAPALRRHVAANGGELVTRLGVHCRPLSLLSPRLRPNPAIEVIEDDIVRDNTRFQSRFDVIRAANVLNRYLDPQMLSAMFRTLRSRLRVGGLLVICRTDLRDQNSGTIFRLRDDGAFEVVRRIGNGSEIERFVLAGGDPAVIDDR